MFNFTEPVRKQRMNSYHTRKHMGLMGQTVKSKNNVINLNSDLIDNDEYQN